MSRRVKDFIEIGDSMTLDELIERLAHVRDTLPVESEARLSMRGDDVFGRHLCISYLRPQTEEEEACEARYADAVVDAAQRELSRLHDELGFCPLPARSEEGLRKAA